MSGSDQGQMTKKKGRVARFGGYFGRRIGNPFISRVGKDTLQGGAEQAGGILRPEKVSRAEIEGALRGRYGDGGRARFAQMMAQHGVQERDLPAIEKMRTQHFRVMCAISLFALCLGTLIPFFTDDWLIMISGLVFGLFSLVFLAIALRHDFAAWQIRNRRFGGMQEYFEDRWRR